MPLIENYGRCIHKDKLHFMETKLHSVGFEKLTPSRKRKKAQKEFILKVVLVLMSLIFLKSLTAQVTSYSFTEDLTTYSPIAGGTVYNSGNGANRIDDQTYTNLPIGFTFNYNLSLIHI